MQQGWWSRAGGVSFAVFPVTHTQGFALFGARSSAERSPQASVALWGMSLEGFLLMGEARSLSQAGVGGPWVCTYYMIGNKHSYV